MSIDIDWENLTTGPDGLALAETIREFIHDKFQQVALPRFIRSVEVLSFDFGQECPVVELKDVCDPLPDFYESDEEEDEKVNKAKNGEELSGDKGEEEEAPRIGISGVQAKESLSQSDRSNHQSQLSTSVQAPSFISKVPTFIDTRMTNLRSNHSLADHIATPLLSRSSTPGIPGGTSNLSYFHLPLSSGLSTSSTPLAAVAGGTPYSAGWQDYHAPPWEHHPRGHHLHQHLLPAPAQHQDYADPSTRPSTADSYAQTRPDLFRQESIDGTDEPPHPEPPHHSPDPSDLQIVLRISYSGNIRISLKAEILLDYPMPSFVGIPLKLNITGLTFDGVALIAYLRQRAHFCFLGQDDAEILVGSDNTFEEKGSFGVGRDGLGSKESESKLGGLLREIRVESEIGQKEGGKQVLKNVGKVEKFVLEQVRRIFEDEFVYPSFWTFLV